MRVSPSSLGAVLLAASFLAGCASTSKGPRTAGAVATPSGAQSSALGKRGGYYEDDGPGANPPDNLDQLPDAVPRVEPYLSGANRPYSVFGREYVPDTAERSVVERGVGSWYGRKFNGQRTSSGEIYDMYAMTAAHPTLPIPSYARVTNPANGRSVIVRINDRGPFHPGRIIDLSFAAAYRLGYTNVGSTTVEVERLLPRDIAAGRFNAAPLLAAKDAQRGVTMPPAPIREAPDSDLAQNAPVVTAVVVEPPAATPIAPSVTVAPEIPADLVSPEASARASAAVAATPDVTLTGHYLQLAAFRARAGADDFLQHLSRQLDPALAGRLRVVAGDSLFRVQLGPYSDRGEAEGAAGHLRDDLGIATLIVAPR